MKIIEVENLTKEYGKGDNKFKALDDITFDVSKGEFVAILGKSGSGKSTLLNIIGGLDKPTDGKVYINNQDIYSFNDNKLTIFRRKNIGFVYQFFNLIPALTVYENILLPALFDGKKIDEIKIDLLLKNLGILERKKFYPNDLSGGEQQRAAIGRALINRPKIILADEPTGNLDSRTSRKIMKLLKFYNMKFKQTIIMVTHDEVLAREASRIIVISDGKIIKDKVNVKKVYHKK